MTDMDPDSDSNVGATDEEDSLSGQSGDEETDDATRAPITQREELSLPEFRKKYDNLVREIQELPDVDDDDPDSIVEQAQIIAKNISDGSKLMTHVGTDTAKLQCTLRHVKVCMEHSDRKFKKLGTTEFNLKQYIDLLIAHSLDSREDYNEDNLLKLITAEVHKSMTDLSSFVSLLGVADLKVVGSPRTLKARTINKNKYALDETQMNATQHQIVNTDVLNGDHGADDDSVSASQILAAKLKKTIAEKHTTALGFYEFGLQDGTATTHDFVGHVFSAASLARDGFAKLIHNAEEKVTDKRLPYSNWKIQDAIPPPKTKKKNTAQRFQQIISFNATTFKTLVETTMASPHNNHSGSSRKGRTNEITSKKKSKVKI